MKTATLSLSKYIFCTLIACFFFQPSILNGQITVDRSSIELLLEAQIDIQIATSLDSEAIITLIEQTGENQTWDFTQLQYESGESSGGRFHFTTNFSGKPGADEDHFQEATLLLQSNLTTTENSNEEEVNFNLIGYSYAVLNDTSLANLGNILFDSNISDQPFQRSYNTPSELQYLLPMTFESAWQQDYQVEFDGDFGNMSQDFSVSAVVDGWGEIILPGETAEKQLKTENETINVLRITTMETVELMGFGITSREISFVDQYGLEVASLSIEEMPFTGGFDDETAEAQIFKFSEGEPVSNEKFEDNPSLINLHQNYPNPFNPNTLITFNLNNPERVTLSVYSLTGQKVQTLVNGEIKQAGSHTLSFNADNLASGIYIYRLQAGNQLFTRKMTLLK